MANPYAAIWGGSPSGFAGVDQGIDFTGKGDVYALGAGVVTRYQPSGSGWPGQGALLSYKITSGPAVDKFVYVAEDFLARAGLTVGSTFSKGDVLGTATGSGQAPGIETGWASGPQGGALALFAGHNPTALGADFLRFVKGEPGLGSRGRGGTGTPVTGMSSGSPIDTFIHAIDPRNLIPAKDSPAGKVVGAATAIPDFLGKLADPNLWIRILEIIGGALLFGGGLFLLAKNVGLSAPSIAPTRQAAAVASGAV